MKHHDRFESLAGAIALGEATPGERETFAAHASECALCRQDMLDDAAGFAPFAVVEEARDDETWRPSLDRAILTRIRERSADRSRFTVGALGWAAALSIAVNVVFATGIGSQIAGVLHPAVETEVMPVAAASFVRLPPRTFARAASFARRGLALGLASGGPHPHKHPATPPFAAALAKAPVVVPAAADPLQSSDISDLLDTNGARTKKNVAVEMNFHGAARP